MLMWGESASALQRKFSSIFGFKINQQHTV
jgi:hypothetical protein